MALRRFSLIAGFAFSVHALAGVGGTSAGVSTTIPTQGTDPSADVQAQSAGFVQQNQQLQNPAGGPGVVLPVTAGGPGVVSAQGNAANTSAAGNSKQKPGDSDPANAAPAAPPTPPPPPPTYVSVVKHLTPQTSDPKGTSETVAVVPGSAMPATRAPAPEAGESPAVAPTPPTPVVAPHAADNRTRALAADANIAKNAAAERTSAGPVNAGGSGDAPDGFSFYLGLGIAIALLVFALAAYLRAQRDEAAIRPPGA